MTLDPVADLHYQQRNFELDIFLHDVRVITFIII